MYRFHKTATIATSALLPTQSRRQSAIRYETIEPKTAAKKQSPNPPRLPLFLDPCSVDSPTQPKDKQHHPNRKRNDLSWTVIGGQD